MSMRTLKMGGKINFASGGARTHDHKVKSLALYQLSYRGIVEITYWNVSSHRGRLFGRAL